MAVQVLDLRTPGALPRYVTGSKKGQLRAYETPRDLAYIDAVGVHHLGPNIGLTCKPGQSVAERAAWRALRQPYHVWAQPGLVVLAWPFEAVTWHGGGLNRRSVGLVAAGCFPSTEAKRLPHHDRAEDYAEALAVALEIIVREVPIVDRILTHSQTSAKPADPGEMVARIVTRAGRSMSPPLHPRPDFAVGTGRPWPPSWRVPLTKG